MAAYEQITLEPDKRGSRPCVRGTCIAMAGVLDWLAACMSHADIIAHFSELTEDNIRAALAYAADRERRVVTIAARSSPPRISFAFLSQPT